jgi:transposase
MILFSGRPIREPDMSKPVPVTRSDKSGVELRREASRCSDGAVVRRLLAIALVLEGRPRSEAAQACGMDRQTLRDWVHHYNKDGIDGLSNRRSPGRPAQLTAEQLAAFKALVEQGPDLARDGVVRWRCSDLQARLQSDFAVKYHERSVGKLLAKLSFRKLTARPFHPEQDSSAQETHKKTSQP